MAFFPENEDDAEDERPRVAIVESQMQVSYLSSINFGVKNRVIVSDAAGTIRRCRYGCKVEW